MTTVPAWRRLGLKLKSESIGSPLTPTTPNGALKRKASGDGHADQHGSGEKPSKRSSLDSHTTNGLSNAPRSALKARASPAPKSVSFAADTAPPGAHESESESEPEPEPEPETKGDSGTEPDVQDGVVDDSVESVRRREAKREKRRLRQEQPKAAETPPKPYLAYLDDYCTNRGNWKFNKNHQNQLFKYLFDVHKIDPSFDDALIEYVEGLQGDAARRRIEEGAQKLLSQLETDPEAREHADAAEDSTMETPEARAQAKDDARRRDAKIVKSILKKRVIEAEAREYAKEFPAKLRQRQRAEKLLDVVRRKYNFDDSKLPNTNPRPYAHTSANATSANATPQSTGQRQQTGKKRSRGRKRRALTTGVPDDDEISDSSSAISSDSSDEDSSDDDDESSADSSSDSEDEAAAAEQPQSKKRRTG